MISRRRQYLFIYTLWIIIMNFLYFYIFVEKVVLEDNGAFSSLISGIQMPTMRRGTIKVAGYSKWIQQLVNIQYLTSGGKLIYSHTVLKFKFKAFVYICFYLMVILLYDYMCFFVEFGVFQRPDWGIAN